MDTIKGVVPKSQLQQSISFKVIIVCTDLFTLLPCDAYIFGTFNTSVALRLCLNRCRCKNSAVFQAIVLFLIGTFQQQHHLQTLCSPAMLMSLKSEKYFHIERLRTQP